MLTPHSLSKNENEKTDRDRRRLIRNIGLLSVIVTDLLGYTGAGLGLGYLAWKKWGVPWWIVPLTTMLGLSLAMYRLYQISQKDWD